MTTTTQASSNRRVLITAGLPYSNGRSHVGHLAGAYLPSDIYARFLRSRGVDVRFVCGSDDHGVPILLSAEKEGTSPGALAAHYHKILDEDFKGFGITFDIFDSTSRNPYHKDSSQALFLDLYEKGFLSKETSLQFYDEQKEMFLPDRYVQGTCGHCGATDQNGDQCENCGKLLDVETLKEPKSVLSGAPVTIRETAHWFIDLSAFSEDVATWLEKAHLRPHTRNFVKGLLANGLVKRAMTRDLPWGIPVPLEDPDAAGKVLYVWFDAPIGYVSNTKRLCETQDGSTEAYADWWKSDDCEIVHFIGEDNTIFHCIIWIAMLKAEGTYRLPDAVVVNQFLNFETPEGGVEKFSKSRGNAIWLGDYLAQGGNPDVLRYYLTAIAPEKSRSSYVPADLIQRNNTDLANTLGNFVNRIVSFTIKYYGPEIPSLTDASLDAIDHEFQKTIQDCHTKMSELLEGYQFKAALECLMEFTRGCNKYVDEKAPWVTRKTDEALTKNTLHLCLQAIRFIGVVIEPFLPFTSAKMLAAFEAEPKPHWDLALNPLPAGTGISKPEILFVKEETVEENA